ncbi:phosphopantetheine-binding protein, partial [Pseudoalteromonas sp. SMS1]|uniref:phosphopantetheine-binding protein n=1 Tax=Pseudoalteromonas sp. SMS1 TaxID=2908894 RepID=UPI001F3A9D22
VLCDEACTPSDSELQQHLMAFLPAYMMPQHYISVTQWPMTPNGKVDRKALPIPELTQQAGADYHAPQGEVEERLAEIWAELLGIDASTISTSADFFTLGGHSLLVIRLTNIMKKEFGIALDIKELFDGCSIRNIAMLINDFNIYKETESTFLSVEEGII